jgi:drug/metabolite transporter (DMT)-like permease
MPDLMQWSAALLALVGLILWFWSSGLQVPQSAASPHPVARLKRKIRRVAIFAALVSALLQAAGTPVSTTTQHHDFELWALAAPTHITPIG